MVVSLRAKTKLSNQRQTQDLLNLFNPSDDMDMYIITRNTSANVAIGRRFADFDGSILAISAQ